MPSPDAPTYQYITIQQLAAGVWAALAGVNCGIVDLGDRTLVFDTGLTVVAARELRAAAELLTGHPVSYVINSHVHPDHVQGNSVFADDATIIASTVTYAAMRDKGLHWMETMAGETRDHIRTAEERMALTTDEAQRQAYAKARAFWQQLQAHYPTPADYRLPHLTFDGPLTFHGSHRSATLMTFGGGHSPCDAVLHLPAERILFCGDLVVSGGAPTLNTGNPDTWLPILDRLEELGAETLLAGHGPVAPAAPELAAARASIHDMLRRAEAAVASGITPADVASMPVPSGRNEYGFRKDMRFLVERLLAAQEG